MVVRVMAGALLSALVLMLWGFLFWVVLSGPGGDMLPVPHEERFVALLREALPASGTYAFPLPDENDETRPVGALDAFRRRTMAGPTGILYYQQQGSDPMSPRVLIFGFLHFYLSSLLAAILMVAVMPSLDSFGRRAGFVFGLGLFGVVAIRLSDPIWWHLPWRHHLYTGMYHILSWLLAGLVLAWVVRPTRGLSMTDQTKPLWKRALEAD